MSGPSLPATLTVPQWINAIDLAERVFGREAARTLWARSPLPQPRAFPQLEARYFEERLETAVGCEIPAFDLYDDYRRWCRASSCEPASASAFARALTTLGAERRKRSTMIYVNLRFRRDRAEGLAS